MSLLFPLSLRNVLAVDPVAGVASRRSFLLAEGEGGRLFLRKAQDGAADGIDASRLALLPGLIDVHVHFRDPGNLEAESLATGASAAAHGGFTRVVTMPNTTPACDTPEAVRRQAGADVPVRILPSACVSRGRQGREVADLEALAGAGASAFSDDGAMVADDGVMRAAMERSVRLGLPIVDHAMDPSRMGRGVIRDCPLARSLGLPVVPPEAEVEAVRRDIALSRETGCAVHIQHISCAGSLDLSRAARAESVRGTAEATPHHLLLAAEDIPGDDGNWRMNPPLGTREDRAALRRAVLDGTVGLFATDHAPHAPERKSRGFLAAPFGVIGLETALAATYEAMVLGEGMDLVDFVRRWTTAPAALLGLDLPAPFAEDAPADFTLVDFNASETVDPARFLSRSRNCPFAGRRLHGRVLLTVCDGRMTNYE